MTKPILTARLEVAKPVHSRITVFNRGGNAGVLTVNSEDADQVIRIINSHDEVINSHDDLLASLKDMIQLLDDGFLVRDTSKDHELYWTMRQLPLVQKISNAIAAIVKADAI